MKLQPFEIHTPETLEEASALLTELGDDAVPYAGGTELLLLMKLGFAEPRHLVDVKAIEELRRLELVDGALEVGACVTHRALERSPVVGERWPALAGMERRVANARVRGAGTLGGNLCFADPHSDPATFLLAAGAEVVLRRGSEERTLPVANFVLGAYETALGLGELLARVRIPEPPAGAGVAHAKLAFRERPAVTVTCLARRDAGDVVEVRLAVGSVGVRPVRVPEAERALLGAAGDRALAEAGEAAAAASTPVADANGSVEYKRNLVRVLVGRTFRRALELAA